MSQLGLDQSPEESAKQAAIAKRANIVMIVSAISILFCCVGGIVATYLAGKAKQDADVGELQAAETKTTIAIVLMAISYFVGFSAIVGQLKQLR